MASGNRFVHSESGYRQVMNGPEMFGVCDARGQVLAAQASGMSGSDYAVDTRRGINRIHTRVSTVGVGGYMRERSYGALAIAAGTGSLRWRPARARGGSGRRR